MIVGTCEEWLQWFIPGRVGDMRDVFLNVVAILCGLLFSVGIDPPARFSLSLSPASRRRVGIGDRRRADRVRGVLVSGVHLGTEVNDPEAGRFRSLYDGETLLARAQRSRRGVESESTDRQAGEPQPRRPVSERRIPPRAGAQQPLA